MTDKIGKIKNPLTIIAIFAGIAEVSGTTVLPFVVENNQIIFIYFLISFPALLVILFFLTLNFNNKVLYAPSDYKNEENFMKFSAYDSIKQKSVIIDVEKDDQLDVLYNQFSEYYQNLTEKIQALENRIINKPNELYNSENKNLFIYTITPLPKFKQFITILKQKGYNFKIYKPIPPIQELEDNNTINESRAIWLGKNIPFNISKEVITDAISFYPHLQYIHISGDLREDPPARIHDNIFIGGSTSTAIEDYKLYPISEDFILKISKLKSKDELYKLIRSFYPKN